MVSCEFISSVISHLFRWFSSINDIISEKNGITGPLSPSENKSIQKFLLLVTRRNSFLGRTKNTANYLEALIATISLIKQRYAFFKSNIA
jgi:hypothetical protein